MAEGYGKRLCVPETAEQLQTPAATAASRRLPAVPLHLNLHLPIRDVRRLIWARLDSIDRDMVWRAHSASRHAKQIPRMHYGTWALRGNLKLIQHFWAASGMHGSSKLLFDICYRGICGGQIEVVRWANERADVWPFLTCSACEWAAAHNQLDMLRWLREPHADRNPCVVAWDWQTGFAAAKYGNIDIIEWACKAGVPKARPPCIIAAQRGYLDILRVLYDAGFPWHKMDLIVAARLNNHTEVEEWISKMTN